MVHGPGTLKHLAEPSSVAKAKHSMIGGAATRGSCTPRCLVRTVHLRVQNMCLCLLHSVAACTCICKCLCAARIGSWMRRSRSSAD
eukprot:1493776-Pleurochrysis_carterae.AAC.1